MPQHTVNGAARTVNDFVFLTIRQEAAVIPLTCGERAFIDAADTESVRPFRWRFKEGYAVTTVADAAGRHTRFLHRLLIAPAAGVMVDHADGDGLNNRRRNLRPCTNRENCRNRRHGFGKSKFKGVCSEGESGRWMTNIRADGESLLYVGTFQREALAAIAYDVHALIHFGEFAGTNFPPSRYVDLERWLAFVRRKRITQKRRVRCVETGVEYESASEAGRQVGVGYGSIAKAAHRKRPAGGLRWEWC